VVRIENATSTALAMPVRTVIQSKALEVGLRGAHGSCRTISQ
jgi:hypothetical protein